MIDNNPAYNFTGFSSHEATFKINREVNSHHLHYKSPHKWNKSYYKFNRRICKQFPTDNGLLVSLNDISKWEEWETATNVGHARWGHYHWDERFNLTAMFLL